ncbi:hypothetical protein [Marinirhabdus gelatinilytica]|uniref:Uncharacterized protein n=1 Tax=Marinirhabdus gelatinilytica TaxID=1703343 RepID=A0A370QLU1_9FLAO|nr:hypothetical protein [Marinirhabdus gelatinilytica]RDK89336.1 hypothetical protein C8D94_1011222 [Marinirhabdus gelatinilytica]
MKKTIVFAAVATMLFVQCEEEKDPFAITNGAIGPLTQKTQMKQLDSIYANDSIVKLNPITGAIETQGEVEIYDSEGAKLLLLSPYDESDPNSKIANVQIFDSRFKTEKGLTKASTFKDVKANYQIAAIENAINSVVVFLKGTDLYLTIDKKELPEDVRYNFNQKIEASQIPDTATFKYFMVGWDAGEAIEIQEGDI